MHTLLIANRGEIARRIIRTARDMGLTTVSVFSDADASAPHVFEADRAVRIGPAPPRESYLDIERILDAARSTGADAIHPGYGFLSENADFAQACSDAGITFVGPAPETIRVMGSKAAARKLMVQHGVPVIPGSDEGEQTVEALIERARGVGFPLLVKASAGGGGKGMRVVREESALADAIAAAKREALSAFGDDMLLLERYLDSPRHIEFQILGDAHGNLVHVFERECSIQRRHQKIVEETPSPALTPELRERMAQAALAAGRALDYQSAGTVELILEPDGHFYFLEINTRLQVEHPVTEMTTGLDLVRLQLLVAQGHPLPLRQEDIHQHGHAIECRIYAEDPQNNFLPATGTLADWHFENCSGLRLDAGVVTGSEVGIHYDPMLAKVITYGTTRAEANRKMLWTLERASIQGVTTNRDFLLSVLRHKAWQAGDINTHFIDTHLPPETRDTPPSPELLTRSAIAATVAQVVTRAQAPSVLPQVPLGWRNNRWRDTEQCWRYGEEELEVRYRALSEGRYAVQCGALEAELRVLSVALPELRIELDGAVQSFRVIPRNDGHYGVHSLDGTLSLEALSRFPEAAIEEVSGGCVAPMPGKVLDVLVEVGQEVEAGAALVILEAMKMEMTLNAPAQGTVASVLVEAGQQVEAQALLVTLG